MTDTQEQTVRAYLAQHAPGVPVGTWPESTGLEKVQRFGLGVCWIATEVFVAAVNAKEGGS